MRDSFFRFVKYSKSSITGNYWKIHLSPILADFSKIISFVDRILKTYEIDYKYVQTAEDRIWMSSINSPISQTGKLITIYPKTETEARNVMEVIYSEFRDLPGIEILSDRSFNETKYIWYRWGMHVLDTSVPDQRFLDGRIPKNIPDLFPNAKRYITGNKLQQKYHIKYIISENAGGNIYFGENKNHTNVLIKEARKNVLVNATTTKESLKEQEFFNSLNLYQKLKSFMAKPIEIVEEPHSSFFVYEYINGENLQFIPSSPKYVVENKSEDLIFMLQQLIITVKNINKYIDKIDIHPNNFVWTGQKITYIDLETPIGEEQFKTDNYWLDSFNEETNTVKNIRKIGMIILFFMGDINYFLFKNKNIERALLLALQKTVNNELPINLYQSAVYSLLNKKPNFDELVKILTYKFDSIDINIFKVNNNLLDPDSAETGFNGLGSLIENGLDENKIENSLSKRILLYDQKIFLKRQAQENQISPYFSDGLAGLAIAIINRQDLQLNNYLKYFDGLTITDGKSPGFYEGLLGIAYANIQLFKKTSVKKYLDTAWIQIRNASQYVEFKNGYSYFRTFDNTKLENNVRNGFEGFTRIYEEIRNLSKLKVTK